MIPATTAAAFARLARTAEAVSGRPLDAVALEQFTRYLDLLLSWNRVHRLTAFDSPDEIVRGLFEDSLLFLPLLPAGRVAVVDIGAGAGIPGIPLRIVNQAIRLTLIEAKRKRVSFLRTVRRTLGLQDVDVVEGRAEDMLSEHPHLAHGFDVAVSRGVAPASCLLEAVKRYLMPGGVFIISGPPVGREAGMVPEGMEVQVCEFPSLGLVRAFFVAAA